MEISKQAHDNNIVLLNVEGNAVGGGGEVGEGQMAFFIIMAWGDRKL